jgi:hypothetical protein
MQRKQQTAVTGFAAGLGLAALTDHYTDFPYAVRVGMYAVALVIFILLALPFLRSLCPKCKGRYHSISSLYRHPDKAPPCKSCGFDINKHISMY